MKKVGLVLEGGGLRGAYTAGVLSWLIEQGLQSDYVVGISSGALYGSMYVLGVNDTLKQAAIDKAADWRNIGFGALLFEGTVVGYNYMFQTILHNLEFPLEHIALIPGDIDVGVYDMEAQETIWIDKHGLDPQAQYIQAACTLPVMGRAVTINGKKYMDGGITTMIPVHKSIEHGCDRHVIVTTKSSDFVRKPQAKIVQKLLRWIYRHYPKLVADFESRTRVYYEERQHIDALVSEGKTVYLFPSQELGVKRFSGNKQQFEALFQLAYDDCETRKDELFAFYHKEKG